MDYSKYDLTHAVEDYQLNKINFMKKWYQSWTVWFNIAMLVITAVNEFNQIVPLPLEVMTFFTVCGNLLLRFKTVTGIK